jgi:hypothetical protein
MKKTLNIDAQLLSDAKSAARARTDTDTVRLALEALVRHGATSVSGRQAREVRRRRERGAEQMHQAPTLAHGDVVDSFAIGVYMVAGLDGSMRICWGLRSSAA